MATYKPTFTINAEQMEKITDFLGYKTKIIDPETFQGAMILNPQNRPLFLLGKVRDFLRDSYKGEIAKELKKANEETLENLVTNSITVK